MGGPAHPSAFWPREGQPSPAPPAHSACCTPLSSSGVNVTTPDQPGTPPLASTQMQIDLGMQEFQLVDLSRRFLAHDSFWTLPKQFLGNKANGGMPCFLDAQPSPLDAR